VAQRAAVAGMGLARGDAVGRVHRTVRDHDEAHPARDLGTRGPHGAPAAHHVRGSADGGTGAALPSSCWG
jgi:hypothetical protein